mmetsp:Transcript_14507/g.41744  ORF Transcript_14507/g.41744 Transcript_14507/m.41744 type:complete len:278 (+) Transcript_14507:891-1724(+)
MDYRVHRAAPADALRPARGGLRPPPLHRGIQNRRGHLPDPADLPQPPQGGRRLRGASQGQAHGHVLREAHHPLLGQRELPLPRLRLVQVLHPLQGIQPRHDGRAEVAAGVGRPPLGPLHPAEQAGRIGLLQRWAGRHLCHLLHPRRRHCQGEDHPDGHPPRLPHPQPHPRGPPQRDPRQARHGRRPRLHPRAVHSARGQLQPPRPRGEGRPPPRASPHRDRRLVGRWRGGRRGGRTSRPVRPAPDVRPAPQAAPHSVDVVPHHQPGPHQGPDVRSWY